MQKLAMLSSLNKLRRNRSVTFLAVFAVLGSGIVAMPVLRSDSAAPQQSGPQQAITQASVTCGISSPAAKPALAQQQPAFQAVVGSQRAGVTSASQVVSYAGAQLVIGSQATAAPVTIGVTPLTQADLPRLDSGMTNVTQGPLRGYQFTPHPFTFRNNIQISLPYDPKLVGSSFTANDVYTYFFDDSTGCWRSLQRVRVDQKAHVVVSLSNHFTDMINATVAVPDHPEGASFNPNQIKDIQSADPGSQVNLIQAPTPNNTGDAQLTYPIEVPPGRAGLQPQLSIGYSSGAGDGWLGVGWDLPLPMITIDTQFGVPRYDPNLETETYTMGGEELTPVANRGAFVPRTAEQVFHTRVEGKFEKIIRHGTAPGNYTWECVDKTGTHWFYGGAPDTNGPAADSTLATDSGNIFEWALREAVDPNGNLMRFHTVVQTDPGVAGGSVPGRDLYLQSITYTGHGTTEGPYSVTFIRDRDLGEPRRPDVAISARGGFVQVTADLLRRIEVKLGDQLIRRYDFSYHTGAFNKTLLTSISQFGEDGALFNTHTFTYYNDIQDAQGNYQAYRQVNWTSPDDGLNNGAVNGVSPGAGEAGALNGTTCNGVGGHLYTGFGVLPTKAGSIGFKTGFSDTSCTGQESLLNVDGDGLPDKVFVQGGTVFYRDNLGGPAGQPAFSPNAVPLQGLPAILGENSNTLTLGVEAYPGAVAAQLDHVDTTTTTSQYFADVNGDGILDFVNGNTILYGSLGPDGVPSYSPVPPTAAAAKAKAAAAKVSARILPKDSTADLQRRIDSYPLIDAVRRWVAPFDGTIQITGAVHLIQDTSPARAASTQADGVRVAIQQEDTELWSQNIGATDYTDHTPTGVDAIAVHKGDRIYFRVGSVFDGAFDQVSWDPKIVYTGVPAVTDVNGLNPYTYQASQDFTLGGRTSQIVVPSDGTLHLGGTLTVKAALTDDVNLSITQDGNPVFQQTLPAGQPGQIAVSQDIAVTHGQQLAWRLQINSPVDLSQLSFAPTASFVTTAAAAGGPGTSSTASRTAAGQRAAAARAGLAATARKLGIPADQAATSDLNPPYSIDMYPVDDQTAPQQSYTVAQDGTLTVQPALAFNFGSQQPDAQVVFTAKKAGALVAKKVIQITGGQLPSAADMQLTVPAKAGDQLFFDFSTLDATLPAALTSESVQVSTDGGTTFSPAPSAFHGAAAEGIFGQPYRGWSAAGYNGNKDRATQAIVQADLTADGNFKNQVPASLDPQAQAASFAADPQIAPPNSVAFNPAPASDRWQAQPDVWVAPDSMSSSRQGTESVIVPTAADFAGATAVPKMSRCQQLSLTGSVSVGIGSLGGSIATGDCTGDLDYLDMNGDGFPDVVGSGGIQYTAPTGALGATTGGLPDGSVRSTHQVTGNAGAGSAARTITTGQGNAAPPGHTVANTAQSGNDMPPLGIGGDLSTGKSDTSFDLIDINGDGLPDRVYSDGRVALNLGYGFAPAEPWPGLTALNDGSSNSTGLNIGFNTDFYGLAGGASFSSGRSTSKATLVDVNGDGKPDMVFDDGSGSLKVALNNGSGFAPPVPYLGSLGGLTADANAQLGGGAYLEFHACFAVIAGCIIINPGANFSTGTGRTEQEFRDMTGNGVPDMVTSTKDNQLLVAENTVGRTNLLESVTRPMGGSFTLDYTRDGNTTTDPQSRFDLTRITVDDGQTTGGQDTELTTVKYAGGLYNRTERQFYGYRTVVQEQRDPGSNDALYRTVTRTYLNDSYYTRGLLADELTADAAGRPFQETKDTYQLRDVTTGSTSADGQSTTATIFPALVRTDKLSFEGQSQPGQSTFTTMDYDQFGNMTRLFDAGDPGSAGTVETLTKYTASDPACVASYIVGTADVVDVNGDGTPMRHRESTVDCTTGNVTQNRQMLADGTAAVTDMSYDANGNLQTVIGPPNAGGQRYRLDYTYDTVTSSHVTSITDSFGYTSSSTYNLKYGQPESTTDFNNQVVTYAYDTAGRVASVTGPYEAAAGLTTIQFEYHPEAAVPYAVTRHIDRNADGSVKPATLNIVTFDDGLKRVIQTKATAAVSTSPGAPPSDVMTVSGRVQFDFAGRVVAQYYPTTEPLGPGNVVFNPAFDSVRPTRTSYDILDRATRTGLPDGTFTTSSYGFGPDRSGTTRAVQMDTNANGVAKSTFRDARNQITSVRQVNTDSHGNQQVIWTSYQYDPLGEQTKVIDDHGNTTTTTYDNLGRRTVVASPDSGRTETVYDLSGNSIQKITASLAAQHLAVNYDYQFNRLVAIRYPVFTGNDVTYIYGAPRAANNGADRIIEIHDASGVTKREYGPLGEVTKETRIIPVGGDDVRTYTTQYQYDTWNRLQRLTYPDGEVLTYTYDSGGQVNTATGAKGKFTYGYLTRLEYDKFGERVFMQTGDGTTTSYTYNASTRRLRNLTATTPGGYSFQNTTYGYDNVGNVTSIENDALIPRHQNTSDDIGGPSTQTFGYDSLNRLTSAQGQYTNDGETSNQYQVSLSYDTINNITAKNQSNQLVFGDDKLPVEDNTFSYLYSYTAAQPHAPATIGRSGMTYDANGNLISQKTGFDRRQLIWDEENRLQCVQDSQDRTLPQTPESCDREGIPTQRNVYDEQGNRVIQQAGTVSIYPNQSFSQRDDDQFKNIFVGSALLITKMASHDPGDYEGEQFYMHADQIGSTGFLTDAQGHLTEHQEYFPSGETWVSEHPNEAIPFQFTGHQLDPATGFYYYGARYYNPRTGLWQSADQVTQFLPDPQSTDPAKLPGSGGVYNPVNLNLYGYADQNPVTDTDPNGKCAEPITGTMCVIGAAEGLYALFFVGSAVVVAGGVSAYLNSSSAPAPQTATPQATDTFEWRAIPIPDDPGGRTIQMPKQATAAEIARALALVKALTIADTEDIPTYIITPSMNVPQIAAFNWNVQRLRPGGAGEILNYIGPQSVPGNQALVDANRSFACGPSVARGAGQACHEFPYASLFQGGAGIGTGPPAIGGPVDAVQNSREGGYWSSWLRATGICPGCKLRILNIIGFSGGAGAPQPQP